MRKFYLFLTAIIAFVCLTSANAGVKVLYNQTFETSTDAAAAGWTSPNVQSGLTIGSDEYGKFVQFSTGANNDRSAHTLWGEDLVKSANVTSYTVSFEFCAKAYGSNHETNEITVMSDETTCTKKANSNFRANSSNWLFDLTQLPSDAVSSTGLKNFAVNGDSTNIVQLNSDEFYVATLVVDTVARIVEYSVATLTGDVVANDIYEVPEGTNIFATGIYFLAGRYSNVQVFDNIKVTAETTEDVANNPVVTLTGVNNKQRLYNISFMDGEILHINYNGVDYDPIQYADCDGNYVWSNNPNYDENYEGLVSDECTNGTLIAYTTSGSAESEKISTEVENIIIPLPTAVATISSVDEGYKKSYTLTADNSQVPLTPQIFISYDFKGEDGSSFSKDEVGTGSVVDVPAKGEMTITTTAFGYGSSVSTLNNDIEYKETADYDFAHMTDADITAMGFSADGNVTGRYATYGRLFWYDADSVKTAYSTIPQYTKKASAWTDSVIVNNLAFRTIPGVNMYVYKGVGLVADGRKGDDANGNWINNAMMTVKGLTENDFVVKYSYKDYGSNSLHPVAADEADFLSNHNAPVTAVLNGVTDIALLRVSDCIARLRVLSPVGGGSTGISNATVEKANDPNASVYNLQGIRMNKNNLPKGVYIQNGKKFVVK